MRECIQFCNTNEDTKNKQRELTRFFQKSSIFWFSYTGPGRCARKISQRGKNSETTLTNLRIILTIAITILWKKMVGLIYFFRYFLKIDSWLFQKNEISVIYDEIPSLVIILLIGVLIISFHSIKWIKNGQIITVKLILSHFAAILFIHKCIYLMCTYTYL